MKKLRTTFLAALALLFCSTFAQATVLTFDEIQTSSYVLLQNGYGGMNWTNIRVLNSSYIPNSGYVAGTVSGTNVAFNAGGALAMVNGERFDFNGAYLTGAWYDGLKVQIKGYRDDVLLYDSTVVTSASSAQYFAFDYYGVDKLDFISFGGELFSQYDGYGTQFVMDNFTFNATNAIPEPTTLLLLGLGLLGVAGLRRNK